MPVGQLRAEIRFIVEASLLKEGAFDEADEVFDGSFFLGPIGPAHIDADAQFEDGVGEGRIPLGDDPIAPPLEGDGLRPIEDADQGGPAPALEMLGERADQRLGRLIGDQ